MIGITLLADRRIRGGGDMIEVYKLLTGKEKIDYTNSFLTSQTHHIASEDTRRNWQKTDQY